MEDSTLGGVTFIRPIATRKVFSSVKSSNRRCFERSYGKRTRQSQSEMNRDKSLHEKMSRGLDRNGVPKDLPKYIVQSRNLVKYSKFDNFMRRTHEPYQVQQFRCVTLADGTVKRTPLSLQNIERQERRIQNEYREKYGFRMKKLKVNENLSNEREEVKDSNMSNTNQRYEEDKEESKEEAIIFKKRDEKDRNKQDNKDSSGLAVRNLMLSSNDDKEDEESKSSIGIIQKKAKQKTGKKNKGKQKP